MSSATCDGEGGQGFHPGPGHENKRRQLIDSLLERDEFADYWAMKWGDVLRIKAEFPVNLWPTRRMAYHTGSGRPSWITNL